MCHRNQLTFCLQTLTVASMAWRWMVAYAHACGLLGAIAALPKPYTDDASHG